MEHELVCCASILLPGQPHSNPINNLLRTSEVQHNQLTGTIPSSYKFPQMELDENALVGTIPDIYEDVVVQRLYVQLTMRHSVQYQLFRDPKLF